MFILCFVFFLSKLVNVTDLLPYKYVDHCNKEKDESSLIIIISLVLFPIQKHTHSSSLTSRSITLSFFCYKIQNIYHPYVIVYNINQNVQKDSAIIKSR